MILLTGVASSLAAEDAREIAQRALHAAPDGDWKFSVMLSTRRDDGESPLKEGEILGRMEFQQASRGERSIRFEGGQPEEKWKCTIPKKGMGGIRWVDDIQGKPVVDPSQRFLGTAFSMEDLSLGFLAWDSQVLVGEETLKDRACWRISSRAGKKDRSKYAKVDSWIDRQFSGLLKAVAYDSENQILKEFEVRSFRRYDDVWMLKVLELRAPGLKGRSRLEVLEAKSGNGEPAK